MFTVHESQHIITGAIELRLKGVIETLEEAGVHHQA